MIPALLCAFLFAAGHLVRDGWPALGSTHAARAIGGALCGLGALVAYGPSWTALALWLAVFAGFYVDMKHGEANTGEARYALLSGVTSIALAVIALAAFGHYVAAALVPVVALWKFATWRLCFMVFPQTGWFLPTRMAAIFFGFLFGLFAA